MDATLLATIITTVSSAGSTAGVAITALVINNKRFDLTEKRLDRFEVGVERRLDKIKATLELIQFDLKQFYSDLNRLKERTGLS